MNTGNFFRLLLVLILICPISPASAQETESNKLFDYVSGFQKLAVDQATQQRASMLNIRINRQVASKGRG